MAAPSDAVVHAFLQTYTDGLHDEAFFQCSAVELAKKLLGQFLYLPASKTAMRILETEAYPEGDEVHNRMFRGRRDDVKARFKLQGGTLVAWRPLHLLPNEFGDQLYVTAGLEDSSDVVLIRSADPFLGLEVIKTRRMYQAQYTKNLLIGPSNCAMGVGAEWLHNPKLYTPGGAVQLCSGPTNPVTEWYETGPRVLFADGFFGCDGFHLRYRFGLITPAYHRYHSGLQCDSYAEHFNVRAQQI